MKVKAERKQARARKHRLLPAVRLSDDEQDFVLAFMGDPRGTAVNLGWPPEAGTRMMLRQAVRDGLVRRSRQGRYKDHAIVTREQLQAMWSLTLEDSTEAMGDRLKASELLAKSHAMFLDRHQVEGGDRPVRMAGNVDVNHRLHLEVKDRIRILLQAQLETILGKGGGE